MAEDEIEVVRIGPSADPINFPALAVIIVSQKEVDLAARRLREIQNKYIHSLSMRVPQAVDLTQVREALQEFTINEIWWQYTGTTAGMYSLASLPVTTLHVSDYGDMEYTDVDAKVECGAEVIECTTLRTTAADKLGGLYLNLLSNAPRLRRLVLSDKHTVCALSALFICREQLCRLESILLEVVASVDHTSYKLMKRALVAMSNLSIVLLTIEQLNAQDTYNTIRYIASLPRLATLSLVIKYRFASMGTWRRKPVAVNPALQHVRIEMLNSVPLDTHLFEWLAALPNLQTLDLNSESFGIAEGPAPLVFFPRLVKLTLQKPNDWFNVLPHAKDVLSLPTLTELHVGPGSCWLGDSIPINSPLRVLRLFRNRGGSAKTATAILAALKQPKELECLAVVVEQFKHYVDESLFAEQLQRFAHLRRFSLRVPSRRITVDMFPDVCQKLASHHCLESFKFRDAGVSQFSINIASLLEAHPFLQCMLTPRIELMPEMREQFMRVLRQHQFVQKIWHNDDANIKAVLKRNRWNSKQSRRTLTGQLLKSLSHTTASRIKTVARHQY